MPGLLSNLSLVADGIGFAALAWKTIYDLWWNPRRFDKERGGDDNIEIMQTAAKAKRDRADRTTWIAFGALAVSYFIMIIKDLQ